MTHAWGDDVHFTASLDRTLSEAQARAGHWLACRVGCTACCLGPFTINALDARRLRVGLATLAVRDDARAAAVRARAEAFVSTIASGFPGDPSTGLLSDDEAAEERFAHAFAALPCPALDPGTGACTLYDSRPLSCRTFGPPVRVAREDLPPCELCFVGAPAEEVERCRVEVDPDGLEHRLLDELEAEGERGGHTLAAFALALPQKA